MKVKNVKTTHRSNSKPYGVSKSYNRPGKGKQVAGHMTHGKGSKRSK